MVLSGVDDNFMEKIILGTVQFGVNYGINNIFGKPTQKNVFDILTYAKDVGIGTLDTAEDYGDAQEIIGKFHRESPSQFEVISKLSHRYDRSQSLLEHVKETLATLHVPALSLYMFHNFSMFKNESLLLSEFNYLKGDGWFKKIGVSVYSNEELLQAIECDHIDVIQLPMNLLDNNFQKGHLLKLAKSCGKEIHARSVFLQGLFFMQDPKLPQSLKALQPYLKHIHELELKMHTSIENISLQYVYNNPYIDKVLIGVDSREQLARNIHGLAYPISSDSWNEIDEIKVKESWLLNPVNWK